MALSCPNFVPKFLPQWEFRAQNFANLGGNALVLRLLKYF